MTEDPYFRTRMAPAPARASAWEALAAFIQRDVPADARLLDLGAGACHFVNRVRAARRVALDVSPEVVARAAAGVEAVRGSCEDLSVFPDGAFDVVFASNLFEHLSWDAIARTVDEVRRVLAAGGRLIHLHPNVRYCQKVFWDDHTHRTPFTHRAMADFLAARGFRVERLVPRLVPFSARATAGWDVPAWLVRVYLASPWRPRAAQMYMVARKA